jgi:hypothetical protein
MVLGNLIQLSSVGSEDRYLYGNPQMTHFKTVYKRSSNFAINYAKVPFIGNINIDFGKEVKFNLPFKADLLSAIFFKIKFSDLKRNTEFQNITSTTYNSQFTSYVNGIGYNCFEYIKLYINGNLIQQFDSKLIYLINELNNDYTKKKSFYKMNAFKNEGFSIGNSNTTDVNTTLLVPFFFSKEPSYALPLCSLTHSDVQLVIKFKEKNKCLIKRYNIDGDTSLGLNGYDVLQGGNTGISYPEPTNTTSYVPAQYEQYDEEVIAEIESFEVFTENIFLDDLEKKMFLNRELTYLVELYHIGNTHIIENPNSKTVYNMDLEGKNPTKYIMWYIQREDVLNSNYYDNHTYSFPIKYESNYYHTDPVNHILKDGIISLNNADLNDTVDAIFLSDVEMYHKFNNSSEGIIYVFSFSLFPRKLEPSGTMNLSRVLYKNLKLSFIDENKFTNNNFTPNLLFKYYTCYNNILVIKDGLGGLMYQ